MNKIIQKSFSKWGTETFKIFFTTTEVLLVILFSFFSIVADFPLISQNSHVPVSKGHPSLLRVYFEELYKAVYNRTWWKEYKGIFPIRNISKNLGDTSSTLT